MFNTILRLLVSVVGVLVAYLTINSLGVYTDNPDYPWIFVVAGSACAAGWMAHDLMFTPGWVKVSERRCNGARDLERAHWLALFRRGVEEESNFDMQRLHDHVQAYGWDPDAWEKQSMGQRKEE